MRLTKSSSEFRFLRSQRGFGLIEMMITMVVTLIGILATMTVVKTQAQANIASRAQSGASVLGSDVRLQLSRRATCLPSFIAAPTAWTGAQSVSLRVGTNHVAPGQGQSYGLRINSLRLDNWTSMGVTSSGRNLHASDLVLGASSVKWGSDSNEEFSLNDRNIARVIFEVNPDNTVFGCYGVDPETDLGNLLELACASVGGTFTAGTNTCTPKPTTGGGGDCSNEMVGVGAFVSKLPASAICVDRNNGLNQTYEAIPAAERANYTWVCPAGPYGMLYESGHPPTSGCLTSGKRYSTAQIQQSGNRMPAGAICYDPLGGSNAGGAGAGAGAPIHPPYLGKHLGTCAGGAFLDPAVVDPGHGGGNGPSGDGDGSDGFM